MSNTKTPPDIRFMIYQAKGPIEDFPEWARTIGINVDTQDVYIPAGLFAQEQVVVMALVLARKRMVTMNGHVYCPAEWAAENFPSDTQNIQNAVDSVRSCLGKMLEANAMMVEVDGGVYTPIHMPDAGSSRAH